MDSKPTAAFPEQLRVRDALTYIDAVKTQFGDQPEVYNHFLDVMRDFRAQTYVLYLSIYYFLTLQDRHERRHEPRFGPFPGIPRFA